MVKEALYEHLHVDISPAALEFIADAVELGRQPLPKRDSGQVQIEVTNFINECRARVQHAAIGVPDLGGGMPEAGTSAQPADAEDWLS